MAAVGILHTIVPDHWAPIVVVARSRGWSLAHTARSAAFAGVGHVTTTLLLGALLWYAGSLAANRYAHAVSLTAAIALIAFGLWIAYQGWREAHSADTGHAHTHQHDDGTEHAHWHVHDGALAIHDHDHAIAGRTALLLILGSSPMFEGLPAFLSASTKGAALLATMAVVFALSTIGTYIVMCTLGMKSLERTSLGPIEKYGEMLSGLVVACVGLYQLLAP